MHSRYTFKKLSTLILLVLIPFLFSQCRAANEAADRLLFGVTEALGITTATEEAAVAPACSSDITVSTKEVSLIEDGDVTVVFDSSTDNFLSNPPIDADGGTMWGYRSFQSCVYLPTAFTGTVEIPVTLTNPYETSRLTIDHIPYIANAAQAASSPFPSKLVFTANGTGGRQCFTFTRVIDAIRNPVVNAATIKLDKAVMKNASDETVTGTYTGLDPCDISATLEDDEGPGIRVSNISDIMEEPGVATPNSGTFSVRLRTAPTANVTIGINDTYDAKNVGNREGNASPTSLTFTPANFAVAQIVTVSSNDDLEVDGMKIYTIRTNPASSSDADYNNLKPRDVVIYNRDQSVPGYAYERFNGTTGTTAAAGGTITGFATDESNRMVSTYATYKLKLRSKPTNDVTLNLSTNCGTKCQLVTTSLTFTTSNWSTYQNILVEGRSDTANSGNQDYNVTFTVTSSDTTYSTTVAKPIFSIRSCDNDVARLIQPCNFSGSPLGTSGNRFSGAEPSATSQIWMITQNNPGGTVTVPLSSDDTTEGTVPVNVTIDNANYNTMEGAGTNKIVLTHEDDAIVDLSQNWTAITAISTGAIAYDPLDVYATTTDNEDYFYINVTGNTQEGTVTSATIDVCLGANNPSNTVQLNLACTAGHDECGTLSVASITFPTGSQVSIANASNSGCSADGNKQTFTVTGADDTWADGTQTFTITMTKVTAEPNYAGALATYATGSINNLDNEPTGKRIFVTNTTFHGEMTNQGVLGADSNCNSYKPGGVTGTYKALIVSNGGVAVANNRTTGSDWPITANYHYYRCTDGTYANCSDEHQRLFIANVSGLFNPTAMLLDFSANGADEFWTGMETDLSPATQASTPAACASPTYKHNCNGFTYLNCADTPNPVFYGQMWKRNGAGSVSSSEAVCTASKKLICVEQ
jgi:hypothetical protein